MLVRRMVYAALAVALVAWSIVLSHAAGDAGRGLRFNSPGVLDLADRALRVDDAVALPIGKLSGADAASILAAEAIGEDKPALRFSDDEYGCAQPSRRCSAEHERRLLSASGTMAKRDGRQLRIGPAGATPVTFVDWKQAATKTADGDEETHWYLGRLPGSGYERVEVQFGHDAPGSFLVNAQTGKAAFVHNGADFVTLSPDSRLLVTWNSLNPPQTIRVATLDAAGPHLKLQCEARADGKPMTAVFKGWHDATAFDLAVEAGEEKSARPVPVRAIREGAGWRLAAADPAQLAAIGLVCRGL